MINNIGNDSHANTRCWGERSCQSLSQLTSGMNQASGFHGYLAAAWTKIIDVPDLVYGAEFEASCSGFRSCTAITGTENYRVAAYGTLIVKT